jgi:hypothetical protein
VRWSVAPLAAAGSTYGGADGVGKSTEHHHRPQIDLAWDQLGEVQPEQDERRGTEPERTCVTTGTGFVAVPRPCAGMIFAYPKREGPHMAVKKVAVTLPEELFAMVEKARQIEHRTRSEVIQEALRTHFGEPVYTPTPEERELLDTALAEFQRDPESGQPWEAVRREIWPPS